jgi:taurine dioxygenase
MKVVPLDAPLGARIEGICWSDAGKPDIAQALNRSLGEHLLVVVPGAPMTAPQMRDFATAFGTPRAQLLRYKRNDGVPEVSTMVSTIMADGTTDKTALRSEDWHTDDSYMAVPAKATLLHSMEIPSHGGRTWFCSMRSVYEALPESTRQRIDGKRAIHAYDTARARNRRRRERHGRSPRRPTSSTRWCAPIPRPAARRSISTSTGSTASSGSSARRAMSCWTSSRRKRASPGTISATNGRSATA